MENKLEQLLNSLIEKGWEPFGEGCHRSPYKRVGIHKNCNKERIYVLFYSNNHSHWKVLRQVVSKESGLWQFVCENGIYNPNNRGYWGKNVTIVGEYPTLDGDENIGYRDYEYYLIESALKDESELEKFLLDNIKIDAI